MKNRIASLFALDSLLGGTTNGHGTAASPPGHRRKGKGTRAARHGAGKEAQRIDGRTVDKGDPIRCQHDVAYQPVAPVDVGRPSGPPAPSAPVAQQLGDEYDVEAFEEPDEELTPRLADEEEYERLETASGMPLDEEPWPHTEEEPEPVTVRAQSYRKPPTFAAEMTAVEQDLADLAARAAQPAPATSAPEASPSGDSEPEAAAPAPAPAPKPSGHAVFDQMAQGMGYATEFRLPPVQLSQVFSALDRQLDAEAIKAAPAAPTRASTPAADTVAVPPTETLIKDLVDLPAQAPAPESAPVSPG